MRANFSLLLVLGLCCIAQPTHECADIISTVDACLQTLVDDDEGRRFCGLPSCETVQEETANRWSCGFSVNMIYPAPGPTPSPSHSPSVAPSASPTIRHPCDAIAHGICTMVNTAIDDCTCIADATAAYNCMSRHVSSNKEYRDFMAESGYDGCTEIPEPCSYLDHSSAGKIFAFTASIFMVMMANVWFCCGREPLDRCLVFE